MAIMQKNNNFKMGIIRYLNKVKEKLICNNYWKIQMKWQQSEGKLP